jgi:hypothetical protein
MARTAVVAGTATAVVGHSQNKQAAKQQAAADAQMQDQQIADMQAQMDAMQAQQAAPPPPPAPAPAPAAAPAGGGDLMGELTKLADLKAAGVLTDEEFAAAKAKLLA